MEGNSLGAKCSCRIWTNGRKHNCGDHFILCVSKRESGCFRLKLLANVNWGSPNDRKDDDLWFVSNRHEWLGGDFLASIVSQYVLTCEYPCVNCIVNRSWMTPCDRKDDGCRCGLLLSDTSGPPELFLWLLCQVPEYTFFHNRIAKVSRWRSNNNRKCYDLCGVFARISSECPGIFLWRSFFGVSVWMIACESYFVNLLVWKWRKGWLCLLAACEWPGREVEVFSLCVSVRKTAFEIYYGNTSLVHSN